MNLDVINNTLSNRHASNNADASRSSSPSFSTPSRRTITKHVLGDILLRPTPSCPPLAPAHQPVRRHVHADAHGKLEADNMVFVHCWRRPDTKDDVLNNIRLCQTFVRTSSRLAANYLSRGLCLLLTQLTQHPRIHVPECRYQR